MTLNDFHEHSLSLHDMFVVPQDLAGFLEPAREILLIDLTCISIKDRRILKSPRPGSETRLVKASPTPKHEAYSRLLLTVADDGVPIQKPYRVSMLDLVFCLRQLGRY